MKAVQYQKYGSPEVLKIVQLPVPLLKDNELLIKVHATTVNRTDCGFLRGKPFFVRFFSGLANPRQQVLGNEFAGSVVSVGGEVTLFRAGDKVYGYDDVQFGGHAEYIKVPEDGMVAEMPEGLTYDEAAPSTEGAHYALNYIRKAHVQSGHRVLINGSTGAIGSAAVQLAKYFDAHVTAVCDTGHLSLVKFLGADEVIDYTKEDFTNRGQGYDFIFDAVGNSSFRGCKRILKPEGFYCSTELGYMAQNPFLALWTPILSRQKVLFPIPKATKQDAEFIRKLIVAGKFRAVIDRHYPLDRIAEAYHYVELGHKTGNVVITVA